MFATDPKYKDIIAAYLQWRSFCNPCPDFPKRDTRGYGGMTIVEYIKSLGLSVNLWNELKTEYKKATAPNKINSKTLLRRLKQALK